jgi:hypothetical protein
MEEQNGKQQQQPEILRKLKGTELGFAKIHNIGALYTTQNITVEGPLSASLVELSLSQMQLKHPLLSASVWHNEKDEYFFVKSDKKPKVIEVPSSTNWVDKMKQLINCSSCIPDGELPWETYLIHRENEREKDLLFRFHHALFDGGSVVSLMCDLIRFCEVNYSRQCGEEPDQELLNFTQKILPLPLPLEEGILNNKEYEHLKNIKPQQQQQQQETEFPPMLPFEEKEIPFSERKMSFQVVSFTPETLEGLNKNCKVHSVTVNSAIVAAALISSEKHFFKTNGEKHFTLTQATSMRPYCLASNEVICVFASGVVQKRVIKNDSDPWELAKAEKEPLMKDIQENIQQIISGYLRPTEVDFPVYANGRYCHLTITNRGRTSLKTSFGKNFIVKTQFTLFARYHLV